MSDFDDLYGTRFLSAAEVKKPVTAIIERIDEESFARPGEATRTKKVLYVRGGKKGIRPQQDQREQSGIRLWQNISGLGWPARDHQGRADNLRRQDHNGAAIVSGKRRGGPGGSDAFKADAIQ